MARSKKKKARLAVTQAATINDGRQSGTGPGSDWFAHRLVGNFLIIGAGVTMQFVIILLPLVGPAGSQTVHARANALSWLAVLTLASALSGLAWWSKWRRRQVEQGPYPWLSTGLLSLSGLFWVAFMTGILRG